MGKDAHTKIVWRTQDNSVKLIPSHVLSLGSRDCTRVLRLAGQALHTLHHLSAKDQEFLS